jgi:hypothetical protein
VQRVPVRVLLVGLRLLGLLGRHVQCRSSFGIVHGVSSRDIYLRNRIEFLFRLCCWNIRSDSGPRYVHRLPQWIHCHGRKHRVHAVPLRHARERPGDGVLDMRPRHVLNRWRRVLLGLFVGIWSWRVRVHVTSTDMALHVVIKHRPSALRARKIVQERVTEALREEMKKLLRN